MTRPLAVAQPMMGQPVTRVDGRLKVTGAAPYAADNPVPDLVHAALVCSTVARGTVENVDSAAALRHSGVLRVLTDFAGMTLPYDAGQVHSFGQPVAVVAATTLEAALHGTSLVEVRYASQPHVTNVDASSRPAIGRARRQSAHSLSAVHDEGVANGEGGKV